MPFLVCLKKTGPFDSREINIANKGVSHKRTPKITKIENKMSKLRFKNEFSGI